MDAFYGIGLKGSGDIGALAPGLPSAHQHHGRPLRGDPGVIALTHYFGEKIKDMATRMDSFSIEFMSFAEPDLSEEMTMRLQRRTSHIIRELNLVR